MNPFFYSFSDLNLVPGNKSSGFVMSLSTKAMVDLSCLALSEEQRESLVQVARKRVGNAELLPKTLLDSLDIIFLGDSACPRVFSTGSMGGSLGADPEVFGKLSKPDVAERVGERVDFTPHNVDVPQAALALLVLIHTWGEVADALLAATAKVLAQFPPALKTLPDFGKLMPLREFQRAEECNALMPDDGTGYYATAEGYSDLDCFEEAPAWATHVVWFNR